MCSREQEQKEQNNKNVATEESILKSKLLAAAETVFSSLASSKPAAPWGPQWHSLWDVLSKLAQYMRTRFSGGLPLSPNHRSAQRSAA